MGDIRVSAAQLRMIRDSGGQWAVRTVLWFVVWRCLELRSQLVRDCGRHTKKLTQHSAALDYQTHGTKESRSVQARASKCVCMEGVATLVTLLPVFRSYDGKPCLESRGAGPRYWGNTHASRPTAHEFSFYIPCATRSSTARGFSGTAVIDQ